MYTRGDTCEDFTEGSTYSVEILDPDGAVICYVVEPKNGEHYIEALLSHLNR